MAFKKAILRPVHESAVREARAQSGLTQAAAAALVHSSLRSWQKWESGERQMPISTFHLFLLLARLDGELFEWLGTEVVEVPEKDRYVPPAATADEQE